ncbi:MULTISPECIES: hypothetical protein [unclassified Ensifer]|uniref:hypothetical protein n=1 Tax=unclassified Ensifer TaxID=2633371 RepID=UPI00300FE965
MDLNTGTMVPVSARAARDDYFAAVAAALRRELGGGGRAIKTIMRWTGASGRTAKYWLAGDRGPDGWHLVLLARHSDEVLQVALAMAHRDILSVTLELRAAEAALDRASAILKALR